MRDRHLATPETARLFALSRGHASNKKPPPAVWPGAVRTTRAGCVFMMAEPSASLVRQGLLAIVGVAKLADDLDIQLL